MFSGYHADRVNETCDFIDALLEHGADPKAMNNSGETAPHLCVNTLEFRIMSRFIEHLGKAIKSSGPPLDLKKNCKKQACHMTYELNNFFVNLIMVNES